MTNAQLQRLVAALSLLCARFVASRTHLHIVLLSLLASDIVGRSMSKENALQGGDTVGALFGVHFGYC